MYAFFWLNGVFGLKINKRALFFKKYHIYFSKIRFALCVKIIQPVLIKSLMVLTIFYLLEFLATNWKHKRNFNEFIVVLDKEFLLTHTNIRVCTEISPLPSFDCFIIITEKNFILLSVKRGFRPRAILFPNSSRLNNVQLAALKSIHIRSYRFMKKRHPPSWILRSSFV